MTVGSFRERLVATGLGVPGALAVSKRALCHLVPLRGHAFEVAGKVVELDDLLLEEQNVRDLHRRERGDRIAGFVGLDEEAHHPPAFPYLSNNLPAYA